MIATMSTVWDRTAEFLSDNLAALTPLVLLGIFVPLTLLGSLMPLMILRRFQKAGHKPIGLVGGNLGAHGRAVAVTAINHCAVERDGLDAGKPHLSATAADLQDAAARLRDDLASATSAATFGTRDLSFRVADRDSDGVLDSAAERLGCNKIALGHHREDTLQTLLLNLLYAGKLQAMPAKYRTDDGRFEVIRPLMDCAERDIAAHALAAGYPILPCNLCGSQDGLRRQQVESLLAQLETTIPDVRQVMLHAIKNVRPSHLLDVSVATAWSERRSELRPDRHARLVNGHLPIVD